jgi:hypothetical protein
MVNMGKTVTLEIYVGKSNKSMMCCMDMCFLTGMGGPPM